ncbi:hypothetical protein MMC28_001432 [Mycoblastus sanguinarius]|nr:hypothetical protein [Mycoblastus sanguinarius]
MPRSPVQAPGGSLVLKMFGMGNYNDRRKEKEHGHRDHNPYDRPKLDAIYSVRGGDYRYPRNPPTQGALPVAPLNYYHVGRCGEPLPLSPGPRIHQEYTSPGRRSSHNDNFNTSTRAKQAEDNGIRHWSNNDVDRDWGATHGHGDEIGPYDASFGGRHYSPGRLSTDYGPRPPRGTPERFGPAGKPHSPSRVRNDRSPERNLFDTDESESSSSSSSSSDDTILFDVGNEDDLGDDDETVSSTFSYVRLPPHDRGRHTRFDEDNEILPPNIRYVSPRPRHLGRHRRFNTRDDNETLPSGIRYVSPRADDIGPRSRYDDRDIPGPYHSKISSNTEHRSGHNRHSHQSQNPPDTEHRSESHRRSYRTQRDPYHTSHWRQRGDTDSTRHITRCGNV